MCAKASVCDWLTLGAVAVGAGLAGYKLLAWRRKRAPVNAEQEKEQRMARKEEKRIRRAEEWAAHMDELTQRSQEEMRQYREEADRWTLDRWNQGLQKQQREKEERKQRRREHEQQQEEERRRDLEQARHRWQEALLQQAELRRAIDQLMQSGVLPSVRADAFRREYASVHAPTQVQHRVSLAASAA